MTQQERQGWLIVACLFVTMMLVFGSGRDGFPVFLPAVLEHFRWSHTKGAWLLTTLVWSAGLAACSDWTVSKLLLVSMTQACFHRKAIRVNAKMPMAGLLVKELQNFQANPTAAGNMQFSARAGQHDDIVLSLALLIWEA